MTPIGVQREPAPIAAEELDDFREAVGSAFHRDNEEWYLEQLRMVLEPDRTLVLRDGDRIVAGAGIYTRRLAVPGGEVPVAGVTQVGVRPTHRRRGMLSALMRRQLTDVYYAGHEAIAALWASESVIYGRYGYGRATSRVDLRITNREALLRTDPGLPDVELRPAAEAIDLMRPIHDAARARSPGMLDRAGNWWEFRVHDPENERDGAQALRAAVVDGAYALYAGKQPADDRAAHGQAIVREVVATSPESRAAIWSYLLSLDLIRTISWQLAPVDPGLPLMLTDGRVVKADPYGDALWVRLVDLPRALIGRTYAQPFEVVLEVADDVCPWNAGRWALRWDGSAATCERTALPARLELGVAELGAIYLGGTTLELLARAGRVSEGRPGTVAMVSRAFRGDREPWCPEIF